MFQIIEGEKKINFFFEMKVTPFFFYSGAASCLKGLCLVSLIKLVLKNLLKDLSSLVLKLSAQVGQLSFQNFLKCEGGTFDKLVRSGVAVTRVDDITQFPEILGGRVKTLHPVVRTRKKEKRSKRGIVLFPSLVSFMFNIIIILIF